MNFKELYWARHGATPSQRTLEGTPETTPGALPVSLFLCGSLLLGACSVVKSSDLGMGGKGDGSAQTQAAGASKVNVKMKVLDEDTASKLGFSFTSESESALAFSLAPTSGFTFDVLGCKSDFTAANLTANTPTETVALYAHDHGCFFDLKEFGFGGATYVPVSGTSFFDGNTFDEDRVVYFVNDADATDKVKVRIQDFLSSPLADGEEFTYVFMQIKRGTDFAVQDYSYTETMQVLGVEAPNVAISSMELTAIDAVTGQATFATTLECNVPTTVDAGKKTCPTATATAQHLEDFQSILISEPADPNTFDYDAARALFDDGGNAALIHSVTDAVTVAANQFDIANKQKDGPLHSNKDMYLVVQYKDPANAENRSYRYFKVTIGDPQL
ncbi:MAG: hypothetical protein IOD12_11760 [Silvanigrellales bacterium]|nr:hypothetical protein [Silvanigrellales bacterium]